MLNTLRFSPDVWYTKLIALTVTMFTMVKPTELQLVESKNTEVCDSNSNIAQNANQFGHSMPDFDHTTIIDKARYYHNRLFLEAWHSQRPECREWTYRNPRHIQIACGMFVVSRGVCGVRRTRCRHGCLSSLFSSQRHREKEMRATEKLCT